MDVPSANQHVGGAFTFVRDAGSANVGEIIITEQGSVNATANLSKVRLYYETAETCSYDGTEVRFGTGTVSFNSSQKAAVTTWGAVAGEQTYNGGATDYAYGVALGPDGSVYVAGYIGINGNDWAIQKYKPNGRLDTTWGDSNSGTITWNSGGTNSDMAYDIVVDADSNIYVAGQRPTNTTDWIIRKYDANGDLATGWGAGDSGMINYDSGAGGDRTWAIAIDSSKSIYVGGVKAGADFAVRKYDVNGDTDTTWGDSNSGMISWASGGGFIRALVLDPDDNSLYAAGFNSTLDWSIRKYDANGDIVTAWGNNGEVTYNTADSLYIYSIEIDSSNNIYVGGYLKDSGNYYDLVIRKYDANGDLATGWGDNDSGMITYNSGGTNYDDNDGMVIDADRSIYVSGYSGPATGDKWWYIRKYDVNGDTDTTWGDSDSGMITYNTASYNDVAFDLAIDTSTKNLWVTGVSSATTPNFHTRKYTATGDLDTGMPVGTSQVCVYAVLDVGAGTSSGDTMEIEISDPSTEVAVSAGTVSPGTAVAIGGTTTLGGPTLALAANNTYNPSGHGITAGAENLIAAFTLTAAVESMTIDSFTVTFAAYGGATLGTDFTKFRIYQETTDPPNGWNGTEPKLRTTDNGGIGWVNISGGEVTYYTEANKALPQGTSTYYLTAWAATSISDNEGISVSVPAAKVFTTSDGTSAKISNTGTFGGNNIYYLSTPGEPVAADSANVLRLGSDRHTFFDGSLYWMVYLEMNGSLADIKFKTTANSSNWTGAAVTISTTSAAFNSLGIWEDATHVYVTYSDDTNTYVRKIAISDQSLSTPYSFPLSGKYHPQITKDSAGQLWRKGEER